MIRLHNDYNRGACGKILEKLAQINGESYDGYGEDTWCEKAAKLIREKCKAPEAAIHFLPGATQANFIVHAAALSPIQSVICPDSGHVYAHEAGSIENTGHKLVPLPSTDGKISAEQIREVAASYYNSGEPNYICEPKMVYISFPTEWGTIYSEQELREIRKVCDEYEMYLFADGARLGYGLVAETDVTLKDIANYTDVFYIGGTKVGALCGEAVVFPKKAPKHFFTMIKQQGALLAKGRLLGIQFDTLFTGNLYLEISKNAIETAAKLKAALKEKGYEFFINSPTNQIFVVLENKKMEELGKKVKFSFWEKYDENHTVIRFATSWATKMEDIDALIDIL